MPVNRSETGVTLVEVLVSVAVLSIGLLGLAQLQMNGVRQSQSALLRTQATMLAYSMADRMRANRAGVTAGAYNQSSVTGGGENNHCSVVDASGIGLTAEPAQCTPQQIAQNDLLEWRKMVERQLPGGLATVCLDSTPKDSPEATPGNPRCDNLGSTYVIKVWWIDGYSAESGAPITRLFVTPFVP